jgi:hypothetical protein
LISAQYAKEFFSRHWQCGYFDYERDGFGEVTKSISETIKTIESYIESGCVIKEKYKMRILKTMPNDDKDNCSRVFSSIIEVLGDSCEPHYN